MTPTRCICQDQHRRGYCTEPDCPYAINSIAWQDSFVYVLAALAASISLLERIPNAKKAAPSNKMFSIMLDDYRKTLKDGRAVLKFFTQRHK